MVKVVHGIHVHGSGLISGKSFEPGEIVYRFPGKISQSVPTYQTIQIGADRHTLDFGILANINHSCDPNTVIDTENLSVLALRAIATGDELTFFYPSTEWDMALPFACQCRSPQCLQFVAGARYLSHGVLKGYFINRHILKMHSELLSGASDSCGFQPR
ncbi:MAG TPA: SET domain-containing protein-lysine N-methyltransferase [Smithella sp.]|jgi:hypothetical protein|nr:SET domain-containing protein-lysine N-methyltransferase [Syntrophaceae bacterium]HOZ62338.1 SET domain-containing protein-lysine N-methyltransferase [Smithellaceae bacterium]HPC08983.1 SET domain-containing protein-lysine N-methyltransferase [Smithella sp.]MBP9531543.1 SET domain-containing protein-lysine N-methyltransferase [Syntrophaceae bacterium]HPY36015.1 SET domain-containing protein-lysine N-methyltransferase [Smithellaceae bacterium]